MSTAMQPRPMEEERPRLPSILTPAEMVSRAVETGQGLDMVSKLMELQERWEKAQARKAFDEAIAAAKAEIPIIAHNSTGHNNKSYADFSAYARVVDPILAKHGLSYRFSTSQDDRIRVTCAIRHAAGHYEENSLSGPADASGSKNAIQAIGSTLTYLQRYTLVQALGLAAAHDDDGQAAGGNDMIDSDEADNIHNMLAATGADKERFLKFIGASAVDAIRSKDYDRAVAALQKKAAGK